MRAPIVTGILTAGLLATVVLPPGNSVAQVPESIDQTVQALYGALEFDGSTAPDWRTFRAQFVPGALLIHVTDTGRTVLSKDEFTANFRTQIESGRLRGFREYEVHRTGETYGGIAQVFSSYEADITTGDGSSSSSGINSIQLIRGPHGWQIVSIVWQEATANHPVPSEYRP